MWIFSRKLGRPGEFKDKVLKGLYDAELKETSLIFISKEPKWKEEIKAVLVRQLSPDRHVFKTTYVNSFEIVENSRREDKMRETRNSNTDSSKTAEDNKRDNKAGETQEVSKESVSCEDADKEEQTSDDCRDKEPEWYENLKKNVG